MSFDIKPLEWRGLRQTETEGNMADDAYTSIGRYIATSSGWYLVGLTNWNQSISIEASRSACQSDFDARIRSEIERKAEPVAFIEASILETLRAGGSGVFPMTSKAGPSHRPGCTVPLYSTPPAAPVAPADDISLKAEYLALNILNVDNLEYAKEAIIYALTQERASSPSPVGESRDALIARLVGAARRVQYIMEIVEPRSHTAEYLKALNELRDALAAKEQP